MSDKTIILSQEQANGSYLEKTITPAANQVLGFDASCDPVAVTEAFKSIVGASGSGGTASGPNSHADSYGTACGSCSHADSVGSASGTASHADSTGTASSTASHADSQGCASGNCSHADSFGTASGSCSHADSCGIASGNYSHAAACGQACGAESVAFGSGAVATACQFAVCAPSGVIIGTAQVCSNAATSGYALFAMPYQGAQDKRTVVYINAALGAVPVYTFPTAYTCTPYVYGDAAAVSAAVVTKTTLCITGTTTTGNLFIMGQ